mgnify:CR=1 FL=1
MSDKISTVVLKYDENLACTESKSPKKTVKKSDKSDKISKSKSYDTMDYLKEDPFFFH